MEYRTFGQSGLRVSVLGFGGGHIGALDMTESSAARLLNEVLDLGINVIDTARSYGESEKRIGRHLSHRRHQFILSTKVGYSYKDKPDWSFDATIGTIEDALQKMKTDYIDIVHLHSCDKNILEQGDSLLALERAKEQGKIKIAAYSGENEALGFALSTNRFGSIQCSVNIFDQQSIDRYLPVAGVKKIGIIAKRPLGNAVWRYNSRPDGHGHAVYYDRFQQMGLQIPRTELHDVALRFTAYTPGVDSMIIGTSTIGHLKENLEIIEKGPLDPAVYNQIRSEFNLHGKTWDGLI